MKRSADSQNLLVLPTQTDSNTGHFQNNGEGDQSPTLSPPTAQKLTTAVASITRNPETLSAKRTRLTSPTAFPGISCPTKQVENDQDGQWIPVINSTKVRRSPKNKKERKDGAFNNPIFSIRTGACPDVHQVHQLMVSVLHPPVSMVREERSWYSYTRRASAGAVPQSAQGTIKKSYQPHVALIVVPYVDRSTLEKYCNPVTMPFMSNRKGNICSAKNIFLQGKSDSCSLLNALLAKNVYQTSSDQQHRTASTQTAIPGTPPALAMKSPLTEDYNSKTNSNAGTCAKEPVDTESAKPASSPSGLPATLASLCVAEDLLESNSFPVEFSLWKETNHEYFASQKTEPRPVTSTSNTTLSNEHIRRLKLENHIHLSQQQLTWLQQDPDFVNLLGIDCEMCQTEQGKEVIRISVVRPVITTPPLRPALTTAANEPKAEETQSLNSGSDAPHETSQSTLALEYHLVLDTLVKPTNKVIDYLTEFSGVTEELLKDVPIDIQDVRAALTSLITSDTILVGHSLENDLQCLKIFHSRIIDTSILYPRTQPFRRHALRYLAFNLLEGRIIQQKNPRQKGHSPTEDAQIALELVILKAVSEKGVTFRGCASSHVTVEPLSKSLNTSIVVYDSMKHNTESYPLSTLITNVTFVTPPIDEVQDTYQHDASIVRECAQALPSRRSESPTPISQVTPQLENKLSVCILRNFQRLCHETMLGDIDPRFRPCDVYTITSRITQYVSACLIPAPPSSAVHKKDGDPKVTCVEAELPNSQGTADTESRSTPSQVEVTTLIDPSTPVDNWLTTALHTETPKKTPACRSVSTTALGKSSTVSESSDLLGLQWARRMAQKAPIKHPNQLLPALNEKAVKTTLSEVDKNINLIYSRLLPGDMCIVMSGCGNPIVPLALNRLKSLYTLLTEKDTEKQDDERWALHQLEYNVAYADAQTSQEANFTNPFVCAFLKD